MKDCAADNIIPYFGWNKKGKDTRWISIEKEIESNLWKISEIATGY